MARLAVVGHCEWVTFARVERLPRPGGGGGLRWRYEQRDVPFDALASFFRVHPGLHANLGLI